MKILIFTRDWFHITWFISSVRATDLLSPEPKEIDITWKRNTVDQIQGLSFTSCGTLLSTCIVESYRERVIERILTIWTMMPCSLRVVLSKLSHMSFDFGEEEVLRFGVIMDNMIQKIMDHCYPLETNLPLLKRMRFRNLDIPRKHTDSFMSK